MNFKSGKFKCKQKHKKHTYLSCCFSNITLNFPTLDCPYLGCLICRIHPVSHPIIYNPDYTYLVCFIIKYLTQFSNSYLNLLHFVTEKVHHLSLTLLVPISYIERSESGCDFLA